MSFFKEKYFFLREICFDRGSLSLVVVFFYLQEMINLYLTVLTNLFQKNLHKRTILFYDNVFISISIFISVKRPICNHAIFYFSPLQLHSRTYSKHSPNGMPCSLYYLTKKSEALKLHEKK